MLPSRHAGLTSPRPGRTELLRAGEPPTKRGPSPATRLVLLLFFFALFPGSLPLAGQSWRSVTATRQLSGEDHVSVRVRYGAGRIVLRSADSPDLLYRMELRYDEERQEPVVEYDDGDIRLGVRGVGSSNPLGRRDSEGQVEIQLARDVPTDLDLELGAVRAELDLGGIALRRLDLSTGASDSSIEVSEPNREPLRRARLEVGAADFTARGLGNLNAERLEVDAGVGSVVLEFDGEWRRGARVAVDLGLGSLRLRFPEGLGVRLERDSFLTSFEAGGFARRGEAYYSPEWDTAERKIHVSVGAALGSVVVERIP